VLCRLGLNEVELFEILCSPAAAVQLVYVLAGWLEGVSEILGTQVDKLENLMKSLNEVPCFALRY